MYGTYEEVDIHTVEEVRLCTQVTEINSNAD